MNNPTICCDHCLFFHARKKDGSGQCFRYPPSIVVLHFQEPSVMKAAQAIMQRPTAVRVTMQPHEFCGEFQPSPKNTN